MAFTASDLAVRLSTGSAGTAGNTSTSTPNASLGKYISTTTAGPALFDTISDAENKGSVIDYRCFFVVNTHATDTMPGLKVWIKAQVPGAASASIAVDPNPATPIGSTTAQAAVIATETTTPSGMTFSAPVTDATALIIGDLPAGSCRAIWVKRAAADSPALAGDGVTLGFKSTQV